MPFHDEHCGQETNIRAILINQEALQKSHLELASTLKESMNQLKEILLAEVANKKDIDQLKKEHDLLFPAIRATKERVDRIEIRNAKCDGAGIFENFPKLWNFYQQEQGWRRFVPAACAIVALLCTLYVTFGDIVSYSPDNKVTPHSHVSPITE